MTMRKRKLLAERLEDRALLSAVTQVGYFETWNGGTIPSTDLAGITYHPDSGNLYLADSEINELPLFQGNNIFAVALDGQQLSQEFASGNREPTGITYNEFDGFFYITNDDNKTIQRYDSNLNNPLETVFATDDLDTATDPEGITSDPATGYLYVVDGQGGGTQVLVYDSNLTFEYSFPVSGQLSDAEGIAFDPDSNHLFVVSSADNLIVEHALNGAYVDQYDIDHLTPDPGSPQGLTFAPTSDPLDGPSERALYIADGGNDNFPDGGVYEIVVSGATLTQNSAPLVNAGGNREFLFSSFPTVMDLNAGAADDGLPISPGAMTTFWSQVSGPGMVSFADQTAIDPTVTFSAAGTYVLRLTADDGELVTSDDTTIVVKQVLEIRIDASPDDAEERIDTGTVFLTGADLDLGMDAGSSTTYDQIVGLRFADVNIPRGATINHAYVQFRADETDTTATSLTIVGEDIDDSPPFSLTDGNLSARGSTQSSVAWSPAPWAKNDVGIDQRTPEIASIIQEIVDRPGWSNGNALAILITGTGERVAEPFDGNVPEFAPLIYIEFTIPAGVTINESDGTTNVTEGGTTDSYTVVLDAFPTDNVDVTVTPDGQTDLGAGAGTAIVLTFTPSNAFTPQTVTVAAWDDVIAEGPHTSTITHSVSSIDTIYDAVGVNNVVAIIKDNEAWLYLTLGVAATLPGAPTVDNEDIVAFNGTDFSLVFDGSDVGLAATKIDAFAVIGPDEILLSFRAAETIPGIAVTVEDSDIVKFTASQLGDTTSGTFELFFRGMNVGLSPLLEDVDAVDLLDDGRLVVSTIADVDVPGLLGADEDLIAFTPNMPGDYSSGTWAMYFDGSDVGLAGEDVFGVALDTHGDIHFTTASSFAVAGILGDDNDVLSFMPSQLGLDTAGAYASTLLFDGSQFGLLANHVNAFDLIMPAAMSAAMSASRTARASSTLGVQSLPDVRVAIADFPDNLLGTARAFVGSDLPSREDSNEMNRPAVFRGLSKSPAVVDFVFAGDSVPRVVRVRSSTSGHQISRIDAFAKAIPQRRDKSQIDDLDKQHDKPSTINGEINRPFENF